MSALVGALRELRGVIRDTDRQIQETFEETFAAAARNFEELVGDVFPGGSGRLRLVSEEQSARGVLGGQSPQSNIISDHLPYLPSRSKPCFAQATITSIGRSSPEIERQ